MNDKRQGSEKAFKTDENADISCKIEYFGPSDMGADPEVLQNNPECFGAMSALQAKATTQGARHFFDSPIDVRRTLIAKRNLDGHDTPAGHTYSNIIEILDAWLEYQPQPWATHPSQTLAGKMNYQIGRLEGLRVRGA